MISKSPCNIDRWLRLRTHSRIKAQLKEQSETMKAHKKQRDDQ